MPTTQRFKASEVTSCEVEDAVSHQSLFSIGEVYLNWRRGRGGRGGGGGDTSVFRAVKHTTTVSAHYKLQLAWLQSVPDKYTTHRVNVSPDLQIKNYRTSDVFFLALFLLLNPGFLRILAVDRRTSSTKRPSTSSGKTKAIGL